MTKDMQKAANLTAYGNLMQMVTDFRRSVDKTNKDTDENTFGKMFREKGYRSEGDEWERQVIAGYSLDRSQTGYKDVVTQSVRDYKYYEIPSDLLQFDVITSEKELVNKDPGEASILVKLEMENIQNDIKKIMPTIKNDKEYKFGGYAYERPDPKSFKYENYKESIYYHIGNAPVDFDSEEESFDYDGHGEMGRIVAKLTLNDLELGKYRGKYESGFLSAFELYEGADLSALEEIDLSGNGTFNLKDLLNIFTLGILNWVDGGSMMDVYSTGTQLISGIGSCIAGGAASAVGVGVSVGVSAAMALANYGVQTDTSYLQMRQSTVGYSEEQKEEALNNWGTGRVFGLIGTANSIGASALGSMAGGAVTGASGNALAGAVVGGLVTSGSENAGNYLSDFGQSMMMAGFKSYQQGNLDNYGNNLLNEMGSRFTLGRFAGEQVSAGFGALSSLASGAISNPYGGGMVSTLIGQVGKEASFWTQQSIDTGLNYARTGQYDQNYFANLADKRYGNGDFWSGLALDYGKSAFTTLASSNIENTYLKNLATSAISNGFDSISGRTPFSINTIMQQASIGTITDGIDELIKNALYKKFEEEKKKEELEKEIEEITKKMEEEIENGDETSSTESELIANGIDEGLDHELKEEVEKKIKEVKKKILEKNQEDVITELSKLTSEDIENMSDADRYALTNKIMKIIGDQKEDGGYALNIDKLVDTLGKLDKDDFNKLNDALFFEMRDELFRGTEKLKRLGRWAGFNVEGTRYSLQYQVDKGNDDFEKFFMTVLSEKERIENIKDENTREGLKKFYTLAAIGCLMTTTSMWYSGLKNWTTYNTDFLNKMRKDEYLTEGGWFKTTEFLNDMTDKNSKYFIKELEGAKVVTGVDLNDKNKYTDTAKEVLINQLKEFLKKGIAFKYHVEGTPGHHGLIVGYDEKKDKWIGYDPGKGRIELDSLTKYSGTNDKGERFDWGFGLDLVYFNLENTKKHGKWWEDMKSNL